MEPVYEALAGTIRLFESKQPLELDSLPPKKTALLIVDMVNGFAKEGVLASERIGKLIPQIAALLSECAQRGIARLAFADCHTEDSAEFAGYPPHCIESTAEASMVRELSEIGGYRLIRKNSTNGFLEEEFLRWLGSNPGYDTFILVGDCTDICILQLALSLKAHFNRLNLKSRVIVPINAVDTYDLPGHSAELCNAMALYNMQINGIETVKKLN